jgi:NAD-dependent deacetylase
MMVIPDELVELLAAAEHVAVLTGAGISAESGVPTFREAQTGLWSQYDPEQLATPQAFMNDPRLVWEWYDWRRQFVSRVSPNPAHYALAEMAAHAPRVTLITQNVDGLHQRAGSEGVIELHGNIVRTKCFECGRTAFNVQDLLKKTVQVPPRCEYCAGMLRPDVVWFGESLPPDALNRAYVASRKCDLFFSIGTSALVHPAASLPAQALSMNIPTVEVNPQRTPLSSRMTFILDGPAGMLLPRLVALTWSR